MICALVASSKLARKTSAACNEAAALAEGRDLRLKFLEKAGGLAEIEEPVKIDATPEQLADAVLRPVKIVEDHDA